MSDAVIISLVGLAGSVFASLCSVWNAERAKPSPVPASPQLPPWCPPREQWGRW